MKKYYIKMNEGNILSLGNIINTIQCVADNKNASQSEIFSCIFNINNINNTTINNYCIGYRSIPLEYKQMYKNMYSNKELFLDIFISIVNILDNNIYPKDIDVINNNQKIRKVIDKLLVISKNDKNIKKSFIDKIRSLNNYDALVELLYYGIVENKQPIYKQDINIKINKTELDEYLKVKLYYGQSYISSLIELSKKGNMYASAELGSLEFDGLVSGEKNYKKSFDYYMEAANKNHPKACWMVANLMLSGKVKMDFNTMWSYLNKSIKLGSAAGYNTMGLCYLNGVNPNNKIDIEEAKKYFTMASEYGYVYAFNNLGKIYEDTGDLEEAYKYYKISADMNESWSLNKMGEYYRKKGDDKTAFMYYTKAIDSPINEVNPYAYYNLAKYYYEKGNICANIDIDSKKAKEYYEKANIKE